MHKQFMLAALDQAWLGRGLCAPNPSVGAVAVRDGITIAHAWHQGAGKPHAERDVLAQLPKPASDVTLYITLEPCTHWGRTPPCVDALIAWGVQRVVYGYRDPNPLVQEKNATAILTSHGIEVVYYPLLEINRFYQSYRYWMLTRKPWVTVKLAQTLDGKIAGPQGLRVPISNEQCATFTFQQRLRSDILLTTARTINHDDPLLNVRLESEPVAKPVAILDRAQALQPQASIWQSAQHCHVYQDAATGLSPNTERASYYGITCERNQFVLPELLQHLGELGFHDVWVEAGGTLFTALHQAGLVQRTYLYIAPTTLGDEGTTAYHVPGLFTQDHVLTSQKCGNNLLVCFDWQVNHQQDTSECLPA